MRQIFRIDNGNEEPSQPVLSLRVGEHHFAFAITDKSGDQLYKLSYYGEGELNANTLSELINQHPELSMSFYKVYVCYDHPQGTLVPASYYNQDDAGLLMKTLYGVNGTGMVISESIPDWQLYNVYAVPGDLHNWIIRKFAAGKYWHQYSVALKQLVASNENGNLLVDFRTGDFTVLAASNNKLLLAQTFLYTTPEDVLYYLLKLCQQFYLSQQLVNVQLSGLIDKQSALYKELYQYFINIGFREATWTATNNEYPAHFFTSINDIVKCAS